MLIREEALSALNFVNPSCDRQEWIRVGMAMKDAGLHVTDFINWSKNGDNYKNEKDCITVWNSFRKEGVKVATLFAIAKKNGWKKNSAFSHSHYNRQNEKALDKSQEAIANSYALEIWNRCDLATAAHEYIMQKHGSPIGLRVYPMDASPLVIFNENVAGYLVAPYYSEGKLQTLQFIPPNGGKKLNLNGASANDGFFIVGELNEKTNLIYVCEGLGQAWAINKVTGAAAIVCFGEGRMMKISKILRNKYPFANLQIISDRGKEISAAKIANAISGQWIELPQDKPSNYDVSDYARDHGYEALAKLLIFIKSPELHYKLLSVGEVCESSSMHWIVKGIIPRIGLTALYGPSGSGKSFLLLDLALTIATGEAYWFGHRISAVPIIYVCLEGESGLGKRVKAWFTYTNKPLPQLMRFITQPFNLLTVDVDELVKAIVLTGHTGGLIILDTLNRAAPGADENSPVDMGRIISACGKLQRLTGGMVLLAHHTGKDEAKKLRGHSSLPAALDGAIEVTKNGASRQWTVGKSKDDKDGGTNPFKLEVVNLGVDEDGDAITSCVVDFDGCNPTDGYRRIIPPKAGNQKIVWEGISGLLATSKELGKGRALTGRPCVRVDDAVSQLHGCLACESKRQSERIRAAITGLVSRGLLMLQEGWIWAA